MILSDFLGKLKRPKKQGAGYLSCCPAHDDEKASLSITEGDGGKILVKCHAGCSSDAITGALGLKLTDLFAEPLVKPKRKIEQTYDYRCERGKLLFQSVRYIPKDFRQRRPNSNGGWDWSLNGARLVLYRFPELLAADSQSTVFVCEGERDVDRLRSFELIATTNPMGAGKWRAEYSQFLKGREVVIIPDNDDPGRAHAEAVANSLQGVAASVKVLTLPGLPKKGDVSTFLDTGGSIETLCAMVDDLPEWTPESRIITEPPADEESIAHSLVLSRILDSLEPCDFHKIGGFSPDAEVKQKHYLVLCIRQLLDCVKVQKFALARKNDFIFVFNGQYWKEIDRDTLKDFFGKAAERLGVSALEAQHYEFKDKLYKQFLAAAQFEEIEASSDKVLINLLNGTFEITAKDQKLREFRAEDFLKHQLQFEFNETATAPIFERYLNQVLPEKELQDILAEYFGYVFTRNLKLEKALLLYGTGANGKSVAFDIVNAMLGSENIANYSLSDLMEEHNRAQIANKLLNYGSEINASVTRDVFKNLVSCEPIMARLKYGNSFVMTNYAKLCFNCNELPRDIEQTDAYFRRLVIIPFRKTIPEKDQDSELAQKIIASELSGVFNWVLAGLRRLLANKRFTQSEIVKGVIETYKREADSVVCFLDEEGHLAEHSPGLFGLLKDVYRDYKNYCNDSGMKPLGKQNFRKRLEAKGYEVEKINLGMRVSRKRTD